MLLRSGKRKWRWNAIKKCSRGWWLEKEESTRLKRRLHYRFSSLRREMNIKEIILVGTLKYSCWVRISLMNIKSFMIFQWRSITLHRNCRIIPLWCLDIRTNKLQLTITTSNLEQQRPKDSKNRTIKITQRLSTSPSKIRFRLVLAKTLWISAVLVSTSEWVQPKTSNRRNSVK